MAISNWLTVLLFVLVIVSLMGFNILTIMEQKKSIRAALTKKGATSINISWNPFDFDRSNNSYEVNYIDKTGKQHQTTCKIHNWGSTIYWEEESSDEKDDHL